MGNRSCAAIISNDSVLMVRQTYKGETFWTLPGGRIEQSETPEECAIRETFEETGLEIELTKKVCELFNERINGNYH
ncbi:NUDIX hydrolase [Paenibacillus sp. NPDC056579]|uniref:NUDIX hydrolase n=1 Tax=Paenibacillus sp. NPDC056579 TaxID=3345871 RepID=UPI0036ACD91E|nr:NUDIX hydrolase [Paenibacillus sp. H1-7]